ncbi:APC family permease [Leifsonia sp. Leaf264]|uniref:APC family permease n=1 Tax=Leifsonia sp. Leaf264 TaxID=1736314 RepID=UPI0006FA4FD1|nr:APC family permease [Leifsonia sp. Leaf264]KQP01683.1 amino acid transporter [Leifsonia sp. Leaf264]
MTSLKVPVGTAAGTTDAAPRTLTGSLGVTAIVFMVVAAAAPLTVVGGAAPLGILLGNGVGFPSLYAISAVILLLFSVGLATMTKHVPKPGAFFTFVGYGLGRPLGLAAAYLALFTYTAIQVAVHGYVGYIMSVTIAGLGGPDIPWYVYSLAIIALVGILGYRHIDLSSKVLGIMLVGEIAIVLALVIAVVVSGGPEGLSLAPFLPSNVFSGAPGVGLMFAIAAFIGFEATAIFRDEAKNPGKTIPRATYVAVIGIGVFYTLASWALIMAWGPSKVVEAAAADPGAMVIITTLDYLGPIGEIIINVLLITSMFACVLSFHNVITRYQHSMSSAGVLPGSVASVHAKHVSPHVSSIVQTATAAVLIAVFAVMGLDPVLQVFTWFSGVATLAIALLMALTSIAVIVYFARTKKDTRLWNTVIAPSLGFIGLLGAAIIIALNFPMLLGDVDAAGVPTFGSITGIMLGLTIAFPVFGYLQALYLRKSKPEAYAKITEAIAG